VLVLGLETSCDETAAALVEDGRRDGLIVELQVGENSRDLDRVTEIGIARSTLLVAVGLHGEDVGAVDQPFVRIGIVGPDLLDQLVLSQHAPKMGRPGVIVQARKGGAAERERNAAPGKLLGGERLGRLNLGRSVTTIEIGGGKCAAVDDEGIDMARSLGERLAENDRASVFRRALASRGTTVPHDVAGNEAPAGGLSHRRRITRSGGRSRGKHDGAKGKGRTQHRISSCLSCDSRLDIVISFIPQLFFATSLCFDESRQGEDDGRMPTDKVTSDIDAFREAALSCPIPAAVELIGEKWAFLILRGALNGLHHFEEFQAGLGIARNILSDRLAKMVAGGILERSPDPDDRRRVIYSLTAKGEGLLPVVLAMRQWGEEWGFGKMRVVLADKQDGLPVRKICVLAHDGRELSLHDLTWIDEQGQQTAKAAAE
jgi:DNA-binding HxlR family transcriptional regulator